MCEQYIKFVINLSGFMLTQYEFTNKYMLSYDKRINYS
jgi:hypothetical protein